MRIAINFPFISGRRHTRSILLSFAAFLASCAAPVPEGQELGSFITPLEVSSVQLIREGMQYYNQSRFVDAELKFRQALYLNPGLPNIRLNLAASLDKSGQFEEARALYAGLLKEDPQSVPYLSGMGRLYANAYRFSEARSYYEKAGDYAQKNAETAAAASIIHSLSVIAFKSGDEESAICYSRQALKLAPSTAENLRYIRLLIGAGKYKEAQVALAQASADLGVDNDPDILHLRALAAFGLADYTGAADLETAALYQRLLLSGDTLEMQIVRKVAKSMLPPDPSAIPEETDSEAEELFLAQLRQLRQGGRAATIFWPELLIEKVDALLEADSDA